MKKEKMTLLIVIMILLLGISPLAARENKMAVGIQAGFSATGVVFDIGLGPVYLNVGLNYPLGYSYIASVADASTSETFPPIATLTFDVSTAFALSEAFDLKVGLGGIFLTDFGPIAGGFVGPVLKGEYWVPNKNYGLFVNIHVPIMLIGVLFDDGSTSTGVDFNPLYPLAGIFTSTVGVLYSF